MGRIVAAVVLLVMAGGCSTSVVWQEHQVAFHARFGLDTKIGPFAAVSEPGKQSVTLNEMSSIPRADVAKAVTEGVVWGVLKAGLLP